MGTVARDGYGDVYVPGRRTTQAHRVAYEVFRGPIPEGLHIDHLCRVTCCVNPDHLEPVTPAENNRRAGSAVTHCSRGHEYTPENTYFRKGSDRRGNRDCLECRRIRKRESRARGANW
ncbi:MAG: HNH endonuclease [Acidobacteriales bacterium]|nr:HNH endonuclease [Terriglobales bacterium]